MKVFHALIITAVFASILPLAGHSAEKDLKKKVLYFTKSSGYEHSVVKREGDALSHSERILKESFNREGIEVVCSKDGTLISEDSLKDFDTIILYTSGNLLESGTDKQPPISEEGLKALFEWVKNGGGLIGIHAASDSQRAEEPTDYTKMIGAAFLTHGKQEYANVKVVDPEFPAVKGLPVEFRMIDEWYLHNQINAAGNMRVLAVLETGKMEQEMYNKSAAIPLIWCSAYGEGRVFYTAIGHREDVWEMPIVQGHLIQAYKWTSGDIEGDPIPNFEEHFK